MRIRPLRRLKRTLKHLLTVQRLDSENQAIVRHVVPVLICNGGEVVVCRITFVRDVGRKDAAASIQYALRPHAPGMLNDLMCAHMVAPYL